MKFSHWPHTHPITGNGAAYAHPFNVFIKRSHQKTGEDCAAN